MPEAYGRLGLPNELLQSHIAWDLGAHAVAKLLSNALDATLVSATISRLIYDCNRPPASASAIPEFSECHEIPGNKNLNNQEKGRRTGFIYEPFHAAVEDALNSRPQTPVLVTVHSFTPVFKGIPRSVELGFLHDTDERLANAMLDQASDFPHLDIRRNQPYGPGDGVMHTIRRHGIMREILNVMIEIRNDLIANTNQQQAMAKVLTKMLTVALASFNLPSNQERMI
jgi:predicted N-formylglutamate amidohydrolase